MTDLADTEFDHDDISSAIKRRELNGPVTYEQNGVIFSAGFKPLRYAVTHDEVVEEPAPAPVAKKKKKKARSDRLTGFKDKETPDAVAQALKEDVAAKRAEEFVE